MQIIRVLQRLGGRRERADNTAHVETTLNHPFRAIIFDWDGTAVVDRREDATALARLTEALVDLHVWMVVVTGTHFSNIDNQYCQLVDPALRHHLIISVNRGSEIYGFDREGRSLRRWLRLATPEEDRGLTAVADGVAAKMRDQYHLDTHIDYDRLNRRKIDIIPLPEWSDPPKAQIGELLKAVQQRLQRAHVVGGISGVIRLAEQLAQQQHLEVRITSDVKHVEVGLTDKADAIKWIKDDLLQPEGIPWHDVLIAGDEFGPIAGFDGSDDRMRVGIGSDTTVISVGVEPNGVPKSVLNLGGGPAHFRELLAQQIALHQQIAQRMTGVEIARDARREAIVLALATTPDPAWSLTITGHTSGREQTVESQLALSNGAMGARGTLELPVDLSNPRNLIAGLFAPLHDAHPVPALVSGPNWSRLHLTVNGVEITSQDDTTVTRTLDLRHGLLYTNWRWPMTTGGALTLRTIRGVSLANRALAWHLARLDVEQPADIAIASALEPLDITLQLQRNGVFFQTWQTTDTLHTLTTASAAQLDLPDQLIPVTDLKKLSYRGWHWQAKPDQPAIYSRLTTLVRDNITSAHQQGALDALCRAKSKDLAEILDAHTRSWEQRWQDCEIVVVGDDKAQRALHFALYHLIGAANPDDSHISIGGRALTGDGYHGHVFWDTEIYLLPYYTFTWPTAARALLMYRYFTLPAAREKAQRLGYRGALYAWESADTGAETTPDTVVAPDGNSVQVNNGREEQHISADIAYAVWQYYQATDDLAFFLDAGAAIILETARFWASRSTLDADGRYHIRGVIGPDEYHENIDDNAFTNGMASWNLACGGTVAQMLMTRWPDRWQEISQAASITAGEVAQWPDIAARLITGKDATTGIYEQFAGYAQLEQIDLAPYAGRKLPIDIVIGQQRTQRSQILKQADVVMLLALQWDNLDAATRAANFHYYEPRTAHGSSLSQTMYGLVAARLGDTERATDYFQQAVRIDGEDGEGNGALGIHIATQAGLWQMAVFGFAGVRLTDKGICLDPQLPATWSSLNFPLQWRGRQLTFAITRDPGAITITTRGRPLDLFLGDTTLHLTSAKAGHYRWDDASKQWLEQTSYSD